MKLTKNIKALCSKYKRFNRYHRFSLFLKYVKIRSVNTCWEWKGGVINHYGGFHWPEKDINLAHIAAYEFFIGSRHGLKVCHSCDNTLCVNPNHLWLGTSKQNTHDMIIKGRSPCRRGERNPNAKLTLEKVAKIKKLYSTGRYTQSALGIRFNVPQPSISAIILDKQWVN